MDKSGPYSPRGGANVARLVRICAREHQGSQFPQRTSIHIAFEEYNVPDGLPVVDPPPLVELRRLAKPKVEVRFLPDESQHIPNLLLTDANGVGVAPNVATRQPVTEPSLSETRDFHMPGEQTYFLIQLTKESVPRTLFSPDASLGELPSLLPYTPGPKYPTSVVAEDDSDVGSVPVGVNHWP